MRTEHCKVAEEFGLFKPDLVSVSLSVMALGVCFLCVGLVERLLHREAADLHSRPVHLLLTVGKDLGQAF